MWYNDYFAPFCRNPIDFMCTFFFSQDFVSISMKLCFFTQGTLKIFGIKSKSVCVCVALYMWIQILYCSDMGFHLSPAMIFLCVALIFCRRANHDFLQVCPDFHMYQCSVVLWISQYLLLFLLFMILVMFDFTTFSENIPPCIVPVSIS